MDLEAFLAEWHNDSPVVLVHTSGSTGKPKPMWVEKQRMLASARITCDFLGLQPGDTALLCMPLDYIAGKMMVVRSLERGLKLTTISPSGHPLAHFSAHSNNLETVATDFSFAAMVPLQVYNSLSVPEECERLKRIRHLIIGGGAVDNKLAEALRDFPHNVWSTYGMTETLSHVALRRLNGPEASEWYTPFPSVDVSLNEDGCLVIDAPLVHEGTLVTNDMAELKDGKFRILGRKDNVICSGGIKIQIEEVERLLHEHTDIPLLITQCHDERLGEAVVLLTETPDVDDLRSLCHRVLPRYWQPRHYLCVDHLPLTETGKPARKQARQLAEDML